MEFWSTAGSLRYNLFLEIRRYGAIIIIKMIPIFAFIFPRRKMFITNINLSYVNVIYPIKGKIELHRYHCSKALYAFYSKWKQHCSFWLHLCSLLQLCKHLIKVKRMNFLIDWIFSFKSHASREEQDKEYLIEHAYKYVALIKNQCWFSSSAIIIENFTFSLYYSCGKGPSKEELRYASFAAFILIEKLCIKMNIFNSTARRALSSS